MIENWAEELVVGSVARTRARTITETDVVNFAALSGDWNPLHTDAVFAERAQFGRRIAHGMLTLSIATGLIKLEAPYVKAFYGIDELRFRAPVFPGDTILVESVLTGVEMRSKGGVASFDVTVSNQHGAAVLGCRMRFLAASKAEEADLVPASPAGS